MILYNFYDFLIENMNSHHDMSDVKKIKKKRSHFNS